eukprot:TRINITY_DN10289_c0_g1_i1.p1 TRINITY_DN10289_c0_g1~~TRINITY_DN10289_c0_g1_i1.p1  ORF type:complete len:512 (+),score=80.38 TRINITY_DN10289_c0_g1_i1:148-1683(+)
MSRRRMSFLLSASSMESVCKKNEGYAGYGKIFERKELNQGSEKFVEALIPVIEKQVEIEGLYRVSGNVQNVRTHIDKLEKGKRLNFEKYPIHEITALLKTFCRTLPEPLFTFGLYEVLVEAMKIEDAKTQMMTLHDLLRLLPPLNFTILAHLMGHLSYVAYWKSKNGMDRNNLAIVFGPSLMRSSNPDPHVILDDARWVNSLLSCLIQFHAFFFENEDESGNSNDSQSEEAISDNDADYIPAMAMISRRNSCCPAPSQSNRSNPRHYSVNEPMQHMASSSPIIPPSAIPPRARRASVAEALLNTDGQTPLLSNNPHRRSVDIIAENSPVDMSSSSKWNPKRRMSYLIERKEKLQIRKREKRANRKSTEIPVQPKSRVQKQAMRDAQKTIRGQRQASVGREAEADVERTEAACKAALALRQVYDARKGQSVVNRFSSIRDSSKQNRIVVDQEWMERMINARARKIEDGEYCDEDLEDWMADLESMVELKAQYQERKFHETIRTESPAIPTPN